MNKKTKDILDIKMLYVLEYLDLARKKIDDVLDVVTDLIKEIYEREE